jgi:LPS export ABC transporter permease LptG/LPS export ABC transporter permease LptF
MGLIGRTVFLEIASRALLGTTIFTFVLFLRKVSQLFEQLVRGSAAPETVMYLFSLLLPAVLTFTIPVGVLVGTLIALSRMSADAEITAMRASGLSSRRLLQPVLGFALVATIITGAASTWLTPLSIRQTYKLLNKLIAAQLTAEIQPRVFAEQFPDTILYVGGVDATPGSVVRWRNVFLADISSPEKRKKTGSGDTGDGPRITTASEAIAVPDVERNRIQLSLVNGSTHEMGHDYTQYYTSTSPRSEQVLEAAKRNEVRPRIQYTTMDMGPLWREAHDSLDARIELHNRLVLPPACLLLALIGVPLGLSSRKGGKSSAFVLTVIIAFLYYMGLVTLIGLARQKTLPAGIAMWLPNIVLFIAGLFLVVRMERPGDRDIIGSIRGTVLAYLASFRGNLSSASPAAWARRLPIGPQIIDHYVLTSFLFYFGLLLASFVLMTHVYTFFELLSDILKNNIAMSQVAKYLFYLTPMLIYDSTPVSVLVAVLVTFGILTKNNEVTAMKACGVSLYRLAIPVFVATTAMSAGLFAFDHYVIPDANKTQDAIRAQIKGRPTQTYLRPDRKWIFGSGSRIYYYKYLDPNDGVMVEVNVYELEPNTFRLTRHVFAERARWESALNTWIFQDGWSRDFRNGLEAGFHPFRGQTSTFPELQEPPSYFLKEVKQDKQMNFQELDAYIRELQQSGFDTVRLQVRFHKKFAIPLFAVIMALISIPFSFIAANRGAAAGIGVSFAIAIAYWAVSQLFEQVGNVNELPAVIAAWAPDAVFSLCGLYFLARMRT